MSLALPTLQPRLSALLPAKYRLPPLRSRAALRRYHLRHRRGLHLRLLPQDRYTPSSLRTARGSSVEFHQAFSMACYGDPRRREAHGHPGRCLHKSLIPPISLCCMLLGCHKKSIVGEHKHPVWLQILGWCAVGVAGYLAVTALPNPCQVFRVTNLYPFREPVCPTGRLRLKGERYVRRQIPAQR